MNEFMHVAEIALPLLLQGLGTTAAISVLSILIAMVLGSAVGYMCLSKNKAVELIARAFIKIFRCTLLWCRYILHITDSLLLV